MGYLNIHTHCAEQKESVLSVQSLSLTDNVFLTIPKTKPISVGLHPWYAKLVQLEGYLKYLNVVARQENIKMIGECGLDALRGEHMEDQITILKAQIQLAEELNKPLILHCVKAFAELIALKEEMRVKVPMIIHGFNKNLILGEQLLAKGFLLSFGAGVLKDNSGAARLVQETDNFFLETDDSELPIEEIYAHVANLKNCSVEVLKARIFGDWKKLMETYG
ncbi:TatD family hydrolase [Pedobacter insulae]|uniref:TatD DNase family protein n=1 Tax=Pedobacter insulae TaxID=414048 RepID=A0A1I2SUA9_9SPHI|nr:TatD family hydrolase [Pedobacter insulae]SFG56198.1 TatD DNase family protein [Pedobacter insulae]